MSLGRILGPPDSQDKDPFIPSTGDWSARCESTRVPCVPRVPCPYPAVSPYPAAQSKQVPPWPAPHYLQLRYSELPIVAISSHHLEPSFLASPKGISGPKRERKP